MSESKKKERKSKKEEGAPIRSKSSYLHFCLSERENIKKENLDLKNTQIIAELGSRWSKLKETSPEIFQQFEKIALQDKERYLAEKTKWLDNKKDSVIVEDSAVVEGSVVVEDSAVVAKAPKKKAGAKKSKKVEDDVPEPVVDEEVPEEQPEEVPVEKKKKGTKKTAQKK